MTVFEGPEVYDKDHVGPEVAEHLRDHGQGPFERFGESGRKKRKVCSKNNLPKTYLLEK